MSKSATSRRLFHMRSPPISKLSIRALHAGTSCLPKPPTLLAGFMSSLEMPARNAAASETTDVGAPVSNSTVTRWPLRLALPLMAGKRSLRSRSHLSSDTGVEPAQ
jgi:hypothetical protein